MNYYQHHIGDFIRDTARLSDSQCMAYMRMVWMYYDTEHPLPDDVELIAFKIGAEIHTVKMLLSAFFTMTDGVWRHARCDKEIANYWAFCELQKAKGVKGGRPKKKPAGNPTETRRVPDGNPTVTPQEPHGNPGETLTTNHYPLTTKEPKTKTNARAREAATPDGFAEFWAAYPKKVAKEVARTEFVRGNLAAMLPKLLEALEVQSRSEQWTKDGGKFIPNATTWIRQRRWEDELPLAVPNQPRLNDFDESRRAAARPIFGDEREFNASHGNIIDIIPITRALG